MYPADALHTVIITMTHSTTTVKGYKSLARGNQIHQCNTQTLRNHGLNKHYKQSKTNMKEYLHNA